MQHAGARMRCQVSDDRSGLFSLGTPASSPATHFGLSRRDAGGPRDSRRASPAAQPLDPVGVSITRAAPAACGAALAWRALRSVFLGGLMTKYHLTYKDNKWKLKPEGADRAVKTFETKREAIKGSAVYLKAKEGSLRIHKKDGTIQEERTYPRSADPTSSLG